MTAFAMMGARCGVIVEVRGLRKVYTGKATVTAVDGIDLTVEAGEIYGLGHGTCSRQQQQRNCFHAVKDPTSLT